MPTDALAHFAISGGGRGHIHYRVRLLRRNRSGNSCRSGYHRESGNVPSILFHKLGEDNDALTFHTTFDLFRVVLHQRDCAPVYRAWR